MNKRVVAVMAILTVLGMPALAARKRPPHHARTCTRAPHSRARGVAAAPYTASFERGAVVLTLDGAGRRPAVVRLRPLGAHRAARVVADGHVRYVGVYPGIDLVWYGQGDRLEYDFVVAPGADPARIVLAMEGVAGTAIDASGTLVAYTAAGALRQAPPVVYQEIDGVRRRVDGSYRVDAAGHVRFRLGAYDRSRPLVIDPVIDYASYLGGTGDEADVHFEGEVHLARDGAGNLYLTGTTRSTDFPTTPGALSRTLGGEADVFVTKLSPTGAVLYSTFLGGPCEDDARAIAVDGAGNAYVTGEVNGGGLCTAMPGVLVAKLDARGDLVYASRIGGSLLDSSYGTGIAVDGEGHAYVTGVALTSDFPTTPGAYRTTPCPNVYPFAGDGFVAKVSADGTSLVYSTLLCGQGDDSPSSIALDADGNAYVAGATASSDFPLVAPIERSRGGGVVGISGFVSKLSPDGARLVYSTYLGGSGSAVITDVALDRDRNVYVTGETSSVDFPTTRGALQERPGKRHCLYGCTDAFVTKIAASGSALVYSTYLYGELDDAGHAIAVDGTGSAYVVGQTVSLLFPIRDAFQHVDRGLDDAFVAKLSPDGARLVYSSYLGGSRSGESPATGADTGTDVVLDAAGTAYVAGYTQSFDLPTTAGAFQRQLAGGVCDVFGTACGDAFVARIRAGGPGLTPAVSLGVDATAVAPGGVVVATWAGNPTPSPSDYLRLFALGSAGDEFDDAFIAWATPNAPAGRLPLMLPAGLAPGWYELRLLGPDPGSHLPVPIARSEPIHVGGAVPPPPGGTCVDAPDCDDGDPCTADACVAGAGCVSAPVSDVASVTCTCDRGMPGACTGATLPAPIASRRAKVCGLFAGAAGADRRVIARRRLRKAAQILAGSIRAASGLHRKSVPPTCAASLKAELRDVRERATRLLAGMSRAAAPPSGHELPRRGFQY